MRNNTRMYLILPVPIPLLSPLNWSFLFTARARLFRRRNSETSSLAERGYECKALILCVMMVQQVHLDTLHVGIKPEFSHRIFRSGAAMSLDFPHQRRNISDAGQLMKPRMVARRRRAFKLPFQRVRHIDPPTARFQGRRHIRLN